MADSQQSPKLEVIKLSSFFSSKQYKHQQKMQTQQQKQKVEQTFQPQQPNLPQNNQHYINPENLSESKVHSVISHSSNPQNLLKHFQEYQPTNKYIVMKDLHNSQYIKLKKYKQSVYYGDFINGKRHGKGIMVYDDGRTYEGEWECDYKHGKGWEKFGNQSVYFGDYVNGKPEGVGKYSWPNGEFYEGEWLSGMKQGSGMWRGARGDSYIGEWKHGKADGYGVHTWVNGDRYEGEFKQCLKHGQGIQKFSNGDMYKGFYQNGKPSGFGEYYWANGSYFKGKFQNGLRNGEGIWKRKTGNSDKYEGSYENDKKSGYGIFTWATGNIYKGNYEADVRSGYGEMYWSDGSYYRGQWKNGIQHGEGELYVPGQGTKKGIFQDNVLVIVQKQSSLIVTDPNNYLQQHNKTQSINHPIPKNKISIIAQQKQMPQKIKHFRSRDYKVNKSRQHKSIDENLIVRYNPTQAISKQPVFNSSYNHNHPLLPKKTYSVGRQQKYLTIQNATKYKNIKSIPRTSIYKNKAKNSAKDTYQRILHSSFYMHQLHNRATTSINGSRAEVESGYSGYSGSVEYGGRRGRRELDTRAIEQMRYYNRTRVGKESKTPGL